VIQGCFYDLTQVMATLIPTSAIIAIAAGLRADAAETVA
jgi:hypothetical protein